MPQQTIRLLFVSKLQATSADSFIADIKESRSDIIFDHATFDDIEITFLNGVMTAVITTSGKDISTYTHIFFRTPLTRDLTASLSTYALNHGVKILDDIVTSFPGSSKLYEHTLASLNQLAIADSIFLTPNAYIGQYDKISHLLEMPFVLKGIHANRGENNYLVRNLRQYKTITHKAQKHGDFLIAQKFIPNNGDYRLLVFGDEVGLIIFRKKVSAKTHLNNVSQGAHAELVHQSEFDQEIIDKSVIAAKTMGRSIAGVDMMQDSETGKWYLLEVNAGPQITTGSFLKEKEAAFCDYLERL